MIKIKGNNILPIARMAAIVRLLLTRPLCQNYKSKLRKGVSPVKPLKHYVQQNTYDCIILMYESLSFTEM